MVDNSQHLVARYSYDPFGNPIAKNGPLAEANLYQFSSKEIHPNSGFYYYGFRFYDPNLQRWLNRDPLGEPGQETLLNKRSKRSRVDHVLEYVGLNLYGFIANNPISYQDRDGREIFSQCPICLAPCPPFVRHQCKGPPPPGSCAKAITAAIAMLGNIANDARAHCVASCEIAKGCGKLACKCLGNLKEARDLTAGGVEWVCSWVLPKQTEDRLHDQIQGGSVDDSAKDFEANDRGLGIAKDGGDCVKECEARYGTEP